MSLSDQIRVALAPHLAPLRQRWDELAEREQKALAILGGFLLVFFLIFGVWRPSHLAMEKARQQYQSNRQLQAWIQENAPQLRASGGGGPGVSGESVLGVVSNSAASNGFSLQRFEPEGDRVRIWLVGVSFNRVAAWLDQLRQQGVSTVEAQVEKQPDTGLVSVRLTLARA